MERAIKRVVHRRTQGDQEPLHRRTPQQAIAQLEELRRMFIARFGDPDQPMARVVTRRTVK
ncbi:MAG: hypothetical protein AB7S38_00475 [Vulcanimicrobiota bacterium]